MHLSRDSILKPVAPQNRCINWDRKRNKNISTEVESLKLTSLCVKNSQIYFPLNFPSSRQYNRFKADGCFGDFYLFVPFIMVTDTTILSDIFIRDHQKLFNRINKVNCGNDPIGYNLQPMHDKDWQRLRPSLSPAFISSKMKNLLSVVVHVCKNLECFITKSMTM